jgi:hypothetical protein
LKKTIKTLRDKQQNPTNSNLLFDITDDSYANVTLDNTFAVFKSINDILYLIYSNKKKNIICIDLKNKNKISEIKSHHRETINNIRHFIDDINKRDLIISLSNKDNNAKLWNLNNWECILNLENIYNNGNLFSACLLKDLNKYYIITSNLNFQGESHNMKIFDLNGQQIKEINNSNDKTYIIDSYYDKKTFKNYIIVCSQNYVKSYDFNKNELYHKYDDEDKNGHQSITINEYDEIIKLIESSCGIIRIWNFHSGILLSRINIGDIDIRSICLWDKDHLFVGCYDKTIKYINLECKNIIQSLIGHNNYVISVKKIDHPLYGKCIISQGWKNDQIKIWSFKDN